MEDRRSFDSAIQTDPVYLAVLQSNFSKLPVCKFALAHFIFSDFSSKASDNIASLPVNFGYLRSYLNSQNSRYSAHNVKTE